MGFSFLKLPAEQFPDAVDLRCHVDRRQTGDFRNRLRAFAFK
jgi:hypothetical protein